MIQINKSGARYSAIVGIGENLRKMSQETGREYLMLNRGINAVVNIGLNHLISDIDFNSNEIQVYPPVKGKPSLRQAIHKEYFHNASSIEHIFITAGGVNGLDLIFKSLDVERVYLPHFYWGAYVNVLKINNKAFDFYNGLEFLSKEATKLSGSAVIICDPNNPSGVKFDDNELLDTIRRLNKAGVVVIFDSPYRRVFYEAETDDFYKKLVEFENVIISESFSKSVGLSGMRIGFVHCTNKEFMDELAIKLLYATNGINNFAQVLIEKLLTTEPGILAAKTFREKTRNHIGKNISYLSDRGMLANELYDNIKPLGIFVITGFSYDYLLRHGIGSVPLGFFTQIREFDVERYTRICVSVPHEEFVDYFDQLR